MRFTTHEKNFATLFVARQVRTSVVKHATSLINSFCSNVAKQVARLTVAQKKTKTKQFCTCSTLFLYIFLALFCTTTTWNFLVKRFVEEMSFSPWWPLAFLSFLPLLHNNFHAFLPTKVVSFVFYLSLQPFFVIRVRFGSCQFIFIWMPYITDRLLSFSMSMGSCHVLA